MAEIDQQASSSVMYRKHDTLLKRLFPSRIQRENGEHLLRMARTEHEFRETALKIARDAQLKSIEEMYNDYLVRGKTTIRRERAEFVLEQKNMLEDRLMTLSDQFDLRVLQAYKKAELIPNEKLKSKKLEMIDDAIESYHSLTQQLQEEFQNILNEGVKA